MSITISNKFEQAGVAKQATAVSIKQANERLDKSCMLCALYSARKGACEGCPIMAVYSYKWKSIKDEDYAVE